MAVLARKYRTIIIVLALIALASPSMILSASAVQTYRSGHPPVIISAVIDSQRRLEVVYRADDGLTYGGKVYFDNNPLNAEPPAYVDTKYGNFMYCNNKSNCLARWSLPVTPDVGPFTFLSEPLDPIRFPNGTYYVQIESFNEDPFPSTRYWENSAVSVVLLTTVSSSASISVEKLDALKLPIDNGSERCSQLRQRLTLGNRLATAINANVKRWNTALEKVKNPSANLKAGLEAISKWIVGVSALREKDRADADAVCGTAPELVGLNGNFTPIPVPPSNGKSACTKIRNQLNYLNQELQKVVGNITMTNLNQVVRIRQLRTRFGQLSTSLAQVWPTALKACAPI